MQNKEQELPLLSNGWVLITKEHEYNKNLSTIDIAENLMVGRDKIRRNKFGKEQHNSHTHKSYFVIPNRKIKLR